MYSFRHVAIACDIPQTTVRNWANRGIIPAFTDHAPGKYRRFSWRDLVHARIIKDLASLGVPIADANRIARTYIPSLSDIDLLNGNLKLYVWPTSVGIYTAGFSKPDVPTYGCVRIGRVAEAVSDRVGRPPAAIDTKDANLLAETAGRSGYAV